MKIRLFVIIAVFFLLSCADESSSGPAKENSSASRGSEIVCDIGNEGMIVKPADGEMERICKDGSWMAIESSSSGNLMASSDAKENQSSSSSFIESEVKQSSSSNITALSSSEGLSGSSVVQSSDSHEGSQSSSSDYAEESSSSSDDTKLYLCDDGVTYVLDLANCKVESSSSESGTPESSSDNEESSSSGIESSSSIGMSSSSVEMSSSSEESSSSVNSVYDAQNNTLTDLRDGQVYKTVTIGTQVWMAENLNYVPDDTVRSDIGDYSVSICGGGKDGSMVEGDCSVFGRLYAVDILPPYNKVVFCPDGWSIPNYKKWKILMDVLDSTLAGKKMKLNDKDKTYWPHSEASNESGFSAIPAGYYNVYHGFNWKGTAAVPTASFAIFVTSWLDKNTIFVSDKRDAVVSRSFGEGFLISVRCVKD